MASAYADAIQRADTNGWIVAAPQNSLTDGSTPCGDDTSQDLTQALCDNVGDDTEAGDGTYDGDDSEGGGVPDPDLPTYVDPGSDGAQVSGQSARFWIPLTHGSMLTPAQGISSVTRVRVPGILRFGRTIRWPNG